MIAEKLIKSNIVVIASRHDSHAEYIIKGLKSGKHIFVEKPLCLSMNQLQEIKNEYTGKNLLMIGYNRRFAPFIQKLKNFLDKSKVPKAFNYTCNAGYLPVGLHRCQENGTFSGGRCLTQEEYDAMLVALAGTR